MRIAVLGLYNSGSSAIAQMLHHLGVDMGGPPWWELDDERDIDRNHWEPRDLQSKLASWIREPALSLQVSPQTLVAGLKSWIEGREALGRSRGFVDFGAKHPLLARSPRLLKEAWGDETLFLWCYRDLETSIQKLETRMPPFDHFVGHELDAQETLWVQLFYYSSKFNMCKLDWDKVLREPEQTARELADLLTKKPTETQILKATACIVPKRHGK